MLRVCLMVALTPAVLWAQTNPREVKVRADKAKVESEGFWIYNDLARGLAEAQKTGKPLLVVLRCIPCEECVKLDDDLVDKDPVVRPLLEKFVCVRIVGTNGLDLSTFQFDTDQSFCAFMLNADKTIYGRFGTRSHHSEWVGDVSVKGLAKALEGALDLHENYPANKAALAAKRGPAPRFASPEQYPSLREKFTSALNYEGNVVQSCIHCHQIGDAERQFFRSRGEPLPESVLFPYPHPKSIGLILDPTERAKVTEVVPGSWAEQAGFKAGDHIRKLSGQPLLSMADVQWVLHQTSPDGGELKADIQRGEAAQQLTLNLPSGWRRAGDIGWRVSSWGLRRMSLGGLSLEDLPAEERAKLKIADGQMALRAKGVGQYGPHAAAKNAGFQKGDVLVSFDGRRDFPSEATVFQYAMTEKKPGDKVRVEVLRGGQRKEFTLPMQE
jgi:serine protease Do